MLPIQTFTTILENLPFSWVSSKKFQESLEIFTFMLTKLKITRSYFWYKLTQQIFSALVSELFHTIPIEFTFSFAVLLTTLRLS